MSRTRRLAAIVAATGLLIGVVLAVVLPRTTQGKVAAPSAFRALPGPVTEAPMRDERGTPVEERGATLELHPGTLVVEVRRPDPAGGPTWILRSFEADRVYSRIPGFPTSGSRQARRCTQLGREVGGRFGWIDGENVFRPVSTRSERATPTLCSSPKLAANEELDVQLTTLVGHPTRDDRSLLGSVVWGTTGKPVEALTIGTAGRIDRQQQGAGGGFLAFYGPDHSPADATFTRTDPSGRTTTQTLFPREFSAKISAMRDRFTPKLRLETRQIIARAPDPGGGPSQGLMGVQAVGGRWCIAEQGPIVGDRIGPLDPTLGILFEQDATHLSSGCSKDQFGPGQVLSLGSSYGSAENQELLDPGRAALRLQPGRSAMYGIAREDVELITFASPRDVRSIVPTSPAHGFMVVWDGDFAASGAVRITSHLKDGTTRTITENLTW